MINEAVTAKLPAGSVVFSEPNYDNSIIGVTVDGAVVYDYSKMVDELIADTGKSRFECEDFLRNDTFRILRFLSIPPVVVYPLELCNA